MKMRKGVEPPVLGGDEPETIGITITLAGPITVYLPPDGAWNPDGCGDYWEGWASRIPNRLALVLFEDILKAETILRFCIRNRWLLNRKKTGPRTLMLEYNRKVEFREGQTATHYWARRCVHRIREGKKAAECGNVEAAKHHWLLAQIDMERIEGAWKHTLATKEAARIRGQELRGEENSKATRERVERALRRIPESERNQRGLPKRISEQLDYPRVCVTQVRHHMKALGYGAKNKKRGG